MKYQVLLWICQMPIITSNFVGYFLWDNRPTLLIFWLLILQNFSKENLPLSTWCTSMWYLLYFVIGEAQISNARYISFIAMQAWLFCLQIWQRWCLCQFWKAIIIWLAGWLAGWVTWDHITAGSCRSEGRELRSSARAASVSQRPECQSVHTRRHAGCNDRLTQDWPLPGTRHNHRWHKRTEGYRKIFIFSVEIISHMSSVLTKYFKIQNVKLTGSFIFLFLFCCCDGGDADDIH